jgi:signal transduction histidine kinase
VIEHRQTNLSKDVTFVYHNHVSTLTVNADRMHLTNCIHNLVDNSIKYSGDPVRIAIDVRKINQQLVIAVTDNGKGISEKYLPFIFEKFFRVPQGNFHPVKGYGLGLSYVKSIIERHSGYCSVSSDPKSGTTFSIFLPL